MPKTYLTVEIRIKIRKKKKLKTAGLWPHPPQKNRSADSTFYSLCMILRPQ